MMRALISALLVSVAAIAAEPEAELQPGTSPAQVSIGKGRAQEQRRVAAGKSLGLKLTGPLTLTFGVRFEGAAPAKELTALVELDGKVVARPAVQAAAEADAKSNRDLPVTRPTSIEVRVPEGKHDVALRWAADAPGDVLVSVSGVKLGAPSATKSAALPLPGDLPLPAAPAPAKKDTKLAALPLPDAPASAKAAPLPLPDAPAAKKDAALAPLPGFDAPPAAAPAASAKRDKKGDKNAPLPLPGDGVTKALPLPEATSSTASTGAGAGAAGAAPLANATGGAAARPASTAGATAASATGAATGTRTINATRVDDKAGTSPGGQPAGFANSTTGQVDMSLRQRGSEARLWSVTGRIGAERSSESYTEPVAHSHFGLEGTRDFSTAFMVYAAFDWRSSTQGYVISQPNSSGSRSQMLGENRFDLRGAVGYDFGPRVVKSGRLELMPLLGVHYLGIRNDAFPSDLIGAEVSGRVRYALSQSVVLQTMFGYTYNFSFSQTHSALGAPQGDFGLRAGIALPLAGNYALELNYQGDFLSFQYVYRVAHGAALGFSSSF